MASDNFLFIDGIEGESTDDKHKNWIEVSSFSYGVSQMASAADRSVTGAAAGHRADFHDLTIEKIVDKSSPKIFLSCAKGEPIKEVTLELCRAGGDKHKYLEFKMNDVVITSVSVGGGSDLEPSESVTFNFGKIQVTYIPIGRDGKPAGKIPVGWDLTANKAM